MTAPSACPTAHNTVKDVSVIAELDDDSIYSRLWQPYICNLGDGHLVVSYGAQFQGKTDMGDIRCQISRDHGRSWQAPVLIFDHRLPIHGHHYGYLNPSFFRAAGTDTLWCFAMRSSMFMSSGDNSQLVAAYSVDGGWCWQEVPLSCEFSTPLITCNAPVAVERDGHICYLMPVHRGTMLHGKDPNGDNCCFLLESGDLLHWRIGATIPCDPQQKVLLAEASLVEQADGRLTMMHRAAAYQPGWPIQLTEHKCACRSESFDGGQSWSIAEPEIGCHNAWSKAWYYLDYDGSEMYIYSSGELLDRRHLEWVRRSPGAQHWSEPHLFYDNGNRNSYPTLAAADDGQSWHAVWDSSSSPERHRTRICYGRFQTNA